jgi:hypothetical protein
MDTAQAMETAGRAGSRLGDALREYATARFSGVLRVDGRPGGILYLADGGIAGCETPGAPSLEVVLLRSRRVAEADWEAAFGGAAVSGRPMTAELVQRGLLGAGEAEALLRTALADAIFAVVSGRVEGWAEEPPADCPLPLTPAARSGWLLAEATRRSQALASFAGPAIDASDRVTASREGAPAAGGPGPGQGEILMLADGRRTIRDLAFTLGRGLYGTMMELARMRAANLVTIGAYGTESTSPDRPGGIASDAGGSVQAAVGLLPRRPKTPGLPRAGEAGRRNLAAGIHLLRPRSAGGTTADGNRISRPSEYGKNE